MDPLSTAAGIIRHKVSGDTVPASRFRVGMTVTIDPAPFILASGVTKVAAPPTSGSGLANVQAVGVVRDGIALHRLHLDERSLVQLHLGPAGVPGECRYFSLIDEVTPSDAAEWGFWLDEAEGMIGWPEFQTKDGKLYARVWSPGSGRVAPRSFVEVRESLEGTRNLRGDMMLYAAPTGATPPAPDAEYVLVTTFEADGSAWVAIYAGIDLNPATLALTS